ncbi:MAG: DUF4190 domain-containing protein [Chloroflexi bacterium]|nr:DUF4190 domain-containing protein [Chloroflexota bacterium]
MTESPPYSPTNTQSILSLIFGILTILTFCAGMVPIPFTGFICFPASIMAGLMALIFGTVSLNQIRRRGESGRPMAWTGIFIGGFTLFSLLCIVILFASLFVWNPGSIHLPPIFDNYQV